jgi:predicted TIM-barrel fold metal-dependent hydrolase
MDVFDCHMHVGTIAGVMPVADHVVLSPDGMEEERRIRLEVMANNGISGGLVMAALGYPQADGIADTRRVNDGLAAYRDAGPAHFPVAVGVVEPLHGERGLEELDRIHHELGMRGVMWHHRLQGTYIDNAIMRPILRRMREYRMVPFIHVNAESKLEAPWRLAMLAEEFPDMPMVALDAFSSFEQGQEVLYLARHAPNLLFDTALATNVGAIARFVREFGPGRVLYGSNLYSPPAHYRRAPMLESIREMSISEEAKAAILGGNLRRLLAF